MSFSVRYHVLFPDGTVSTGQAEPSKLVDPHEFATGLILPPNEVGFAEHVAVLYKGKRCSMFVVEDGAMRNFPVNARATGVYWTASFKGMGDPLLDPVTGPCIHGIAVLFETNVR